MLFSMRDDEAHTSLIIFATYLWMNIKHTQKKNQIYQIRIPLK